MPAGDDGAVRPGHRPVATIDQVADVPERQLVSAAKADPAAFAPLYLRYADAVYRYCYRRLGSREQAADATSQVFVKAIAGIRSCREESFRSWLFAIAHNVLIDVYRQHHPEVAMGEEMEFVSAERSPEEQAIATDEKQQVVQLLRLLTPDQRQVVELRLAGLNGNEIAAALGRSRASVDTAQSRAISRLRSVLVASIDEGKEANNAIA